MKNARSLFSFLFMLTTYAVNSQGNSQPRSTTGTHELIAVVNKASWCAICKANGDRAGAILMSYAGRGLHIYINDLTDSVSIETSKRTLKEAQLYSAIYSARRKGIGRMMQHCGILKDRTTSSLPTGVVTFLSPVSHRRIKQISIAVSDDEMRANIENMLQHSK